MHLLVRQQVLGTLTGCSFSEADIAVVLKKLLGGREIRMEFLKTQDFVGLLWWT